MHYSSLFQYFYWCAMVPTLVENSKFLCVLVCKLFFVNNYYDWWTHAYCIWNGAAPLIIVWKVKYPLRFVVSYVQRIVRSISNQELFEKHLCNPRIPKERNGATRPSYISYRLKSKVSIMLLCRLCSTRCTAVRIKNCLKSTSAIKIAIMKKNTDDFHYEGKPSCATAKIDTSLSAKMNETQRRTLVSPWRMHCTHCGMPKGTSRAEVTSNSEKIKPIALAVIELCLSEGISQLVTQSSVENSIK